MPAARVEQRHGGPPLTLALSGASGLIGSALEPHLSRSGHRVLRLVRRPARGDREIPWEPGSGRLDGGRLQGIDAAIHLSGEPIAPRRWTERRRRAIRGSRIESTQLLSTTLAQLDPPPSVLLAASAVGFYGDRADQWLDESSAPGEGFLAQVCREWEAATRPARDAGVRVVNLRIGIVLSRAGGALAALLWPFRMGLGGPLGDGRQYQSWISLEDLLRAIHRALRDESLAGALNLTAPEPVPQAELARTLGRVLHRPSRLRVPAAWLRLALGEMADETLLASQRVRPARLLESGFHFHHPELEPALRAELDRG
ncbi:MAG: TIGR01777 family oxidoreductase [Myxococcota bacterium]